MKIEPKPKKRFSFKQLVDTTIDTSYIIALFMLVTLGLPQVVPHVPTQVAIYGLSAVALGYIKGKR